MFLSPARYLYACAIMLEMIRRTKAGDAIWISGEEMHKLLKQSGSWSMTQGVMRRLSDVGLLGWNPGRGFSLPPDFEEFSLLDVLKACFCKSDRDKEASDFLQDNWLMRLHQVDVPDELLGILDDSQKELYQRLADVKLVSLA